MQYSYSYILLIHIPILRPIGNENSEPCLWFLLRSKSSMQHGGAAVDFKSGVVLSVMSELIRN